MWKRCSRKGTPTAPTSSACSGRLPPASTMPPPAPPPISPPPTPPSPPPCPLPLPPPPPPRHATSLTPPEYPAQLGAGQTRAFITGSFTTPGPVAAPTTGAVTPFQTIGRKDVGITLRIKPQISEGSTVRLEIFQEVSDVSSTI